LTTASLCVLAGPVREGVGGQQRWDRSTVKGEAVGERFRVADNLSSWRIFWTPTALSGGGERRTVRWRYRKTSSIIKDMFLLFWVCQRSWCLYTCLAVEEDKHVFSHTDNEISHNVLHRRASHTSEPGTTRRIRALTNMFFCLFVCLI
jgi:hypothetical protein